MALINGPDNVGDKLLSGLRLAQENLGLLMDIQMDSVAKPRHQVVSLPPLWLFVSSSICSLWVLITLALYCLFCVLLT